MFKNRLLVHAAIIFATVALVPLTAAAADLGAEISNAGMHAGLAAQGSDLATVHMHLHHTLNCLVGPDGAGFDPKELNPCQGDGNGAIPDESDAAKKKALQDAVTKATAGIGASDLATAQHDAASVASMLKAVK
jgi:hypothetical protein